MTLRALLVSLLALGALVVSGCGNRQDVKTLGETEGVYVDVGDMSYQVQLSRVLNPNDVEDRSYLAGLPEGVGLAKDETWFAVFMRVNNPTDGPLPAARDFRIVDTQENEFTPVPLDSKVNPFAYDPDRPLESKAVLPDPNSVSGEGDIQGALILFKVKLPSLISNRPLELKIAPPDAPASGSGEATIDLDV
jgi:hypothetical protein